MADNVKNAITRKLSPLEKTAMVAGSNSTAEHGAGLSPDEIMEELLSKQGTKPLEFAPIISRRLNKMR